MPQTIEQFTNDRLLPKSFPEKALKMSGAFGANLTLAKGTALGIKTSDGKLYAYVDANSDGTGVCVGFLEIAIKTDANGLVYLGNVAASASNRLTPLNESSYFIAGVFDTADLAGYDAAALADLKGRVLRGTLIYIP